MKISTRFAEYGLTGAFFLVSQLFVLMILGGTSPSSVLQGWIVSLSTLVGGVPTTLQPSLHTLVTALGLLAIVVIGLCLDLLGSVFVIWEMIGFKRYVDRNREWLDELVDRHAAYASKDYWKFVTTFGDPLRPDDQLASLYVLCFWNSRVRQRGLQQVKTGMARTFLVGAHGRFQSFLVSFIVVRSGASSLDGLVDAMYLWRTTRAISMTLLICFYEFLLLAPSVFSFRLDNNARVMLFVLVGVPFALVAGSLPLRAYLRVCSPLFSLAYLTHQKLGEAVQTAGRNAGLSLPEVPPGRAEAQR